MAGCCNAIRRTRSTSIPADRFVADFIGVMNFVPGKATADGVLAANGARITGKVPAALSPGASAVASVRPERIRLFPVRLETANRTTGTVEALAYHGLDLQLHVRTAFVAKTVPGARHRRCRRPPAGVGGRHGRTRLGRRRRQNFRRIEGEA